MVVTVSLKKQGQGFTICLALRNHYRKFRGNEQRMVGQVLAWLSLFLGLRYQGYWNRYRYRNPESVADFKESLEYSTSVQWATDA